MDEEPMLYLLQQPNLYWKIGDEDHWTVCHEITGDTARLIAAAPELLAALKDLVHYDEGSSEEDSYGYEVLQRCKSAIAKAEGEGRVMSKWLVNVVRVGYASRIIEVDAESEEKAKQLAMDTAGNYQFDEHTSDYEFDWIAPAKAEGRE